MVLTIFDATRIAASLILISSLISMCSQSAFAQSKSSAQIGSVAWRDKTALTPFSQKPLHGQIDGIEFEPTSAEIIFQRAALTGDKITFRDGGGRQIDVTISGVTKFADVIYSQTPSTPLKGATNLRVESGLHALTVGQYGIRISLGKVTNGKTQPVYLTFREDGNNWMEGYIYAIVHERKTF